MKVMFGKRNHWVLAATMLVPFLSGCHGPDNVAESDLGLNMREPEAEIRYWIRQIDAARADAESTCRDLEPLNFTERPFLKSRLSGAVAACMPSFPAVHDVVEGIDEAEIEILASTVNESLSRLRAALGFVALPNVTSLEFAAIVAGSASGLLASERTALAVLEKANVTARQVEDAAGDLLRISRGVPLLERFVLASFLNEGLCAADTAPEPGALKQAIIAQSDAFSNATPDVDSEFPWWPGAPREFLNRTANHVAEAAANGWWFAMYGAATDLSLLSALSEIAETVVPQQDEAVRLHAENMNRPRTVWTDGFLFASAGLEDDEHWSSNRQSHWLSLAYRELEWEFASAPCA